MGLVAISGFISLLYGVFSQHVTERTSSNFDSSIKANKNGTLALFYAPWCGHCRAFLPDFERAAVRLKGYDSSVELVKIDATVDVKHSEKHEVHGFPTVKLFYNNNWIHYDGGWHDIASWVLKKTGQLSARVETAPELDDFVKKYPLTAIYFGSDELAIAVFTNASRDISDVMFAVAAPAVLEHLGNLRASPVLLAREKLKEGCIAMFYPHDDKFAILHPTKGIVIQSEVEEFVRGKRLPIVVKFHNDVAEDIFNMTRPLFFLFYDSVRPEDVAIEAKFREVAPELAPHVVLSTAGIIEPIDQRLMDFLGVEPSDAPTMRLVKDPMGMKLKYKFPGNDWSSEAIIKFAFDAKDGKIAPHYRSQPIPVEQKESVRVVVGDSLISEVMEAKDVVIQFYAPWCGHCKRMEPVMKELGDKYKNSGVVIGQFDATVNDAREVEIIGFPTLIMWPAKDKKNPIEYDGEKDFASISAWIDASVERQEL